LLGDDLRGPVTGRTVALVAIQLELNLDVLASADAYQRYLEAQIARAVDAAGPADARLVVLPECAGHLALYAGAPPRAQKAKTLAGALASMAVRRPLDVLRGALTARALDARRAVLAAFAPEAERAWNSIFAPLAKQYRTWIVAGSLFRLGRSGTVTNASMTYDSDGRLVATTDKVNLLPGVEDDSKTGVGLSRGSGDAVPIVDTPFGTLCTLIGYDGFCKPHTGVERFDPVAPQIAARGGVTIVANPAGNTYPWRERWPFDDRVRVDQWEAEGLPATLRRTPFARFGVTAHLVCKVLDRHFDGVSEILAGDGTRLARADAPDRGAVVTTTVEL
jgi:predicted amidohydrolase